MNSAKKKISNRISVWTLIFALILTVFSASFSISAHAAILDDVGRGAREITSDVGSAVSDVMDPNSKDTTSGSVNDHDGIIGNESAEAGTDAPEDTSRSVGWIGLVIAIVIAVIAIALIVILIPRKKKK